MVMKRLKGLSKKLDLNKKIVNFKEEKQKIPLVRSKQFEFHFDLQNSIE
jgi:hypothetical protein